MMVSQQSLSGRLQELFRKIRCVITNHITPFATVRNFVFCSIRLLPDMTYYADIVRQAFVNHTFPRKYERACPSNSLSFWGFSFNKKTLSSLFPNSVDQDKTLLCYRACIQGDINELRQVFIVYCF